MLDQWQVFSSTPQLQIAKELSADLFLLASPSLLGGTPSKLWSKRAFVRQIHFALSITPFEMASHCMELHATHAYLLLKPRASVATSTWIERCWSQPCKRLADHSLGAN